MVSIYVTQIPYFQQVISESGAPQTLSPEYGIKAAELFFKNIGFFWTTLGVIISMKSHKTFRTSAFGRQTGILGVVNFIGAIFSMMFFIQLVLQRNERNRVIL